MFDSYTLFYIFNLEFQIGSSIQYLFLTIAFDVNKFKIREKISHVYICVCVCTLARAHEFLKDCPTVCY